MYKYIYRDSNNTCGQGTKHSTDNHTDILQRSRQFSGRQKEKHRWQMKE
jgi:hypothetical protein